MMGTRSLGFWIKGILLLIFSNFGDFSLAFSGPKGAVETLHIVALQA